MPGHDGRNTGGDEATEGDKLGLVQLPARLVDGRESEMGVDMRISMPREMLGTGRDARGGESLRYRPSVLGNRDGIWNMLTICCASRLNESSSPSPKERTPETAFSHARDPSCVIHSPMTGFRGSEFTSATGLYTQLIPASFSSFAAAADTCSATSGTPAAANAIAPGLDRDGEEGSH
jgi:hypothetical protein